MKHKAGIIVTISIAITIPLFFISRILGIAERGNQSMGAEMLMILIPIIVWLFMKNWDLMKNTLRDFDLSDESDRTPIIRHKENGGSTQIVGYKHNK